MTDTETLAALTADINRAALPGGVVNTRGVAEFLFARGWRRVSPEREPWPFAGRFREMNAEELLLRRLLWLRHHDTTVGLYGDDGEMQCGQCMLDFRRMDVRDIEARFFELGLANATRIVAKEKS